MFSTYRSLVHLRISWHALSTARVLVRHWHWFLLSMLLVPMGATLGGLLQAFAYPLTAIFSPGNDATWYFTYAVVAQAMPVMWVLLQRNSIRGGEFMDFAASLPISAVTRIGVNLTVLLVANSILLIVLVAAVLISANPFGSVSGFELFAIIVLLVLILVAQLATLERTLTIFSTIFIADWVFALGLAQERGELSAWLLVACALGIAGAGLYLPSFPRRVTASSKRTGRSVVRWGEGWSSPIINIQINALLNRPIGSLLMIGTSATVAAGAVLLMTTFEFDHRSLLVLVLAMDVIAFILSGIYRTLFMAHAQMEAYSATLPLGRHFWSVRDTAFVTVLGMGHLAILLPPMLRHMHVSMTTLTSLCLAYGVLLAALRLPLLYGGRQTALLGFACTILWAAAVITAIL